jgi:streptogramin lyase
MSRAKFSWLMVTILSLVVLRPLPAAPTGPPSARTILTGKVQGSGREALEGVTVSTRAADSTITTSVYTDEKGNYYFPVLPGGKYRVWAQAVGYQAGRAMVSLVSTRETHQDFTLRTIEDFTKQLTSPEWLSALPDDRPEDRRLKQVFVHSCTTCHSAAFALQNRFDEAGWRAILERMETIDVYGKAEGPSSPIIEHYKEDLASYLTKMRGPGPSPMKIKPFPRPTGDATQVVVTEYNIPPAANPNEFVDQDGSDWSEGIPSEGNGAAGLHDIAIDQNGNAWITNGTENRNRSFLKLDVETGRVTNFRLPAPHGFARGTHGIAADQNGIIWLNLFANGGTFGRGSLLRIDPKTEKLDEFSPPSDMGTVGISIQVDAKGKIWAASDGAIVFDPPTEKFTYFMPLAPGTGGYGVAGDAEGNGWFCQPGVDIVGFADFQTKEVGEIRLPPRPGMDEISTEEDRKFYEQRRLSTLTTAILPAQGPRRMAARGDYVWWSNWFGQSISRVNIHTREVNYYAVPIANLSPYDPAVDKNGKVWVALPNDDRVAELDPATRQWTVYNLPSHGTNTRFITVDNQRDSVEVWAVSFVTSKAVRLQFRTREQLQSLSNSNTTAKNTAGPSR